MWIPTPIYERLPQFWLLLGLLFMSSGTYLGFEFELAFLYFGVGLVCCVWSLWIFTMRLRAREGQRKFPVSEFSPPAEQDEAGDTDSTTAPTA